MKSYRIFCIAFLLIFGLTACLSSAQARPKDFNLRLDWNTGALPPQYHYAYIISIDSQGIGEFSYHPGYEEDTRNDWETSFSLTTADQMDELYRYLQENGLLKDSWETGHPLMGGKGTAIMITADGAEYSIPSVSELAEDDRILVNKAIDYINALVPEEIWEEMETRQEAVEELYSENE